MKRTAKLAVTSAVSTALTIGAFPSFAQSNGAIAEVYAHYETATFGNNKGDAADDIAIWVDKSDPSKSLIVGTDKKHGIFIYGMDGSIKARIAAGKVNNVDLRNDVMINGQPETVVAVSDENQPQAKIALYRLDTKTPNLVPLGRVSGGKEKAYGLCLYQQADKLWAFSVFRNGLIEQVAIDVSDGIARATPARSIKLKSNAEGCVADDRTHSFFAAERDVGIWKWGADPDADTRPVAVAIVDTSYLVADVEGLAIAAYGKDSGYLIASSQGSDTFVVYRLADNARVGRFRIVSRAIDGVSHTDGIELVLGDLGGGFPGGLFVAQDDNNRPQPQNFKLVSWNDILKSLNLVNETQEADDRP